MDLTIAELLGVPMEDWSEWIEQLRYSMSQLGEIERRMSELPAAA
jgi:hypothetical protein